MVLLLKREILGEMLEIVDMTETERLDLEHSFIVNFLQMCDEKEVTRSVKYKSSYILRSIIVEYPNILFHPLRERISYQCLKKVQKKIASFQNIQQQIECYEIVNSVNGAFECFEISLENLSFSCTVPVDCPYHLLRNVDQRMGSDTKIIKKIQQLIDFSLLLPYITVVTAKQVLQASLCIYLSFTGEQKTLSEAFVERLSRNAVRFKDQITKLLSQCTQ